MKLTLIILAGMLTSYAAGYFIGDSHPDHHAYKTVTCPNENYILSISTSSDGRTYPGVGITEVPLNYWKGQRCLNCGGIHQPKEIVFIKPAYFFVIDGSTPPARWAVTVK